LLDSSLNVRLFLTARIKQAQDGARMRGRVVSVLVIVALCIPGLSGSAGHVFAQPLKFDGQGGNGTAAFISPLERWEPTPNFDQYEATLKHAGYTVQMMSNGVASLSFLKTELTNYDLIIIRLDSFYYEGLSYFCSGENFDPFNPQSRADYATQYAPEINAHEISIAGPCVGLSMLYVLHNYHKSRVRGLVLAFGPGTPELAAAFINGGAAAFISYAIPVEYSLAWGRFDLYSLTLLGILSEGYTIRDTVTQFYTRVMRGHGSTATWPSICWVGDGDYTI